AHGGTRSEREPGQARIVEVRPPPELGGRAHAMRAPGAERQGERSAVGDSYAVIDAVDLEAHEIPRTDQEQLERLGRELALRAQASVGQPERLGAGRILRRCRPGCALRLRARCGPRTCEQ